MLVFAKRISYLSWAALALVSMIGCANARWETAPIDDIINSSVAGVVRIEVAGTLRGEDYKVVGSGVVISPDGHVQTAAHLIPDALKNMKIHGTLAYEATRTRSERQPIALTVEQIDYGLDLALLKFEKIPIGMRALPLHPVLPRTTERFTALGFAAGSNYMTRDDVIFQAIGDDRMVARFEYHGIVNRGNSGGPILNQDGFVVGLHLAQRKKINGVEVQGIYLGSPTIDFLLPHAWKSKNTKPLFFPGTRDKSSNFEVSDFDSDQWYPKDGEWTAARINSAIATYFTNRTSRRCGKLIPANWILATSKDVGFLLMPPTESELKKHSLQLSETLETRRKWNDQLKRQQSGDYIHLPYGFLPEHNESIMLLRMRWVNEMGQRVDELVPFILHFHNDYYQIIKYFNYRQFGNRNDNSDTFMARCNISNKVALSVLMEICQDFMTQVVTRYFVEDNKCVPGRSR